LHLNEEKCEVSVLGAQGVLVDQIVEVVKSFATTIQIFNDNNAILSGAPIADGSIAGILEQKTQALSTFAKRLKTLSSHSAFFLLRASVSILRLVYYLRASPTWKQRESLADYDGVLKKALESILNCELSPASWLQTSRPVKCGGLGIRQAIEMSLPCFISSVYSVR